MRDNNIRSKVLSRNTTGDLSGLHKTIDYIEVEEAGYQEASNLHEHIQVNTIHRSTYQQLKSEEKKRRCGYCGGQKHGDSNSLAERRDHFRAWGKTCSNCKKENHLANVCRSKSKPQHQERRTLHRSTVLLLVASSLSLPPNHQILLPYLTLTHGRVVGQLWHHQLPWKTSSL